MGHYVRQLENRQLAQEAAHRAAMASVECPPRIAFSRKIGAGALEIADMVAERLGYQVADRELITQIASQTNISEKAIEDLAPVAFQTWRCLRIRFHS